MNKLVIGVVGATLFGVGVFYGRSTTPAQATAEVTTPASSGVRNGAIEASSIAQRQRAPQPPVLNELAPDVRADLHDRDPHVRVAAILEGKGAVPVDDLVTLSRDADRSTAAVALNELARRYADGSIPADALVARIADRDGDPKLRLIAVNGLAAVPSPIAATTFTDQLSSSDPTDRRAAAVALAHQDRNVAVPALIGALGDSDEYVRDDAVNGLRALSRGRDFGNDAAAWRAWWATRR